MLRRTADYNNNTNYTGQIDEFEQKATSTFALIGTLDNESYTEQYYLNKISQGTDSDLASLIHRQLITNDKRIKLNSTSGQKTIMTFPYLYSLPDINDDDIILVQQDYHLFNLVPSIH